MITTCPNKNLPEWKQLESAFGEDRAYLAYFRANRNSKETVIPSLDQAKELIKGKRTVEQSIINELQYAGWISKKRFNSTAPRHQGKVVFTVPKKKTVNEIQEHIRYNTNAVLFERNRAAINALKQYNSAWFRMEETSRANLFVVDESIYNGQRTIDFKDLNDDNDYINYLSYWHSLTKEEKISENAIRVQEGLPELPIEEEFQKKSLLGQKDSKSVVQEKIDRMISILEAKGLKIEVKYDSSMNENGKVSFANGVHTITFNPNQIYEDTTIHEFAHIFINYLGLNNQRIQAAIKRLQTTKLWEEVSLMNPNLDQDTLAKEVLATAMGIEGSQLWAVDKEKANWWNRTKQWFFNIIGIKLNLNENAVKQLTLELIGKSKYETSPVELTYSSRKFYKEINSTKDAVREVMGDLKRRFILLKNMGVDENKYKKLIEMRDKLKEYYSSYDANLLIEYVDYAASQIKSARLRIEKIDDPKKIHELRTFIEGYRILPTIEKILQNEKLEDATKLKLKETIKKALDDFQNFDSRVKEKQIVIAAKALSENSTFGFAKIKENLEIEANRLFKTKAEKDNYIQQGLIDREDEAKKIAYEHYLSILKFTPADISAASAWVNDPASMNSNTISMVTKIIDNADARTRAYYLDERKKISDAYKKFKDAGGNHENLISVDKNGKKYLYTGYNPEVLNEIEDLENEKKELDKKLDASIELHGKTHSKTKEIENEIKIYNDKLNQWKKNNLTDIGFKDKWKDTRKLKDFEKEYLNFLIESFNKNDESLPDNKKLSIFRFNTEFIALPSITKEFYENKNLSEVVNQTVRKFGKIQPDDTELGDLPQDISEFRRVGIQLVNTDIDFKERKNIPVHFRGKIDPKTQSDDLASMALLNSLTTENYRQKKELEPILYTISEATSEKQVGIVSGLNRLFRISNYEKNRQLTKLGKESNEYKALQSTIDVRIYGKHLKEIGDIPFLGSGEKVIRNLEKHTSDLLLGFNYVANIVNVFQGKTQLIIETFASKYSNGDYNFKNFGKAEAKFLKDSVNLIKDYGKVDKTSKTWQILEHLNLFGSSSMNNRFSEQSFLKNLISKDTLHLGQNMGELYIHGTMAYMILDSHKIMNNKREYLDINGKVVDSKEKAASLLDALYFENGQMKFKHGVKTDITVKNINSIEGVQQISAHIKSLAADMFGQYDTDMKSMAQTYWWGRLGFGLRKWIVRGFNKRWRGFYTVTNKEDRSIDKFYNENIESFQEGMYTTTIKWFKTLIRSTDSLKDLIAANSRVWNTLTNQEKMNVLRTLGEIILAANAFIIYNLAKGLAEDDDNKFMYHVAYIHRRLLSEMTFFLNPSETFKILRSPAAAMSTVTKVSNVLVQAGEDLLNMEMEEYQTGYRAGNYKLWEKFKDATPVLNFIDDPERIEEKLRYMSTFKAF